MQQKYYQGIFKPKNPEKYKGDVKNIVYRSSYELKLMFFLDNHPDIIQWGSEEIIIPYKSPIDGRLRRYYMDFIVKKKGPDKKQETILVEVKPAKLLTPPEKKKKVTKRYLTEAHTYAINMAKFKAAEEYCKKKGWKFQIFTEKELGIK